MPRIVKRQRIGASRDAIFAVINDIHAYPHFLEWCTGAKVIERNNAAVVAQLDVSLLGFNESFTTRNQQMNEKLRMRLVHGPFKRLDGCWSVREVQEGSDVELVLEYEFKNPIMAKLLAPAFARIGATMVSNFCDEIERRQIMDV